MTLKLFLLWLPMIALAFANAALRETTFVPHMPELRAHQWSTLTLSLLCTAYAWIIFPHLGIATAQQALLAGSAWSLLTVAFEFTLGLTTRKSWSYMVRQYDILSGHLWPLFLIWLALLPYLCLGIRRSMDR